MSAATVSRQLEIRSRGAAQIKADSKAGRFEAVVSVFGNVDSYGDRMMKGAFVKSLSERGFPPIIWTHTWDDPPIGVTEEAEEVEGIELLDGRKVDGLRLLYQLFVDDNARAKEVDAAQRTLGGDGKPALREYSFAYYTKDELTLDDDEFEPLDARHVRDLLEVDIIEAGPTLLGANDQTGPVALLTALASRRRDGTSKRTKAARAWLEAADALTEVKAGAVLSTANRNRLERAIDALTEILADAQKDDDEDGKTVPEARRLEVAELLAAFPK